jgi:hypothetical protein
MKCPRILDETLGEVEDTWWRSQYSWPITYRSLPDTSKWLCKVEDAPGGGPSPLKVFSAGNSYLFSRPYASIFMLLDLQHLSSLAEAIRLPSDQAIPYLKNLHFLDQLRLHILTSRSSWGESQDDEEVMDPYLMRWVLRLVHRIPNSKTYRKSNYQKLWDIYEKFENENDGSWKMGESYFISLIKIGVDNSLALYDWVIGNEPVLIDAAERVFTYALSDHIRSKDQDGIPSSSTQWIHNIRHEMELNTFHSPKKGSEAKRRGRPKKVTVMDIITPNAESSSMAQTRAQSKNAKNISSIDSLFTQPCVTTSPKKLGQKVIPLY